MVIKEIVKFVTKPVLKILDLDSLYSLRKSDYLKKLVGLGATKSNYLLITTEILSLG